jgi:hypothetical protein
MKEEVRAEAGRMDCKEGVWGVNVWSIVPGGGR